MTFHLHGRWQWRLVWSSVLSAATVTSSLLLVLLLSSGHPSKATNVVTDIIGAPLLPGLGFVSVFWGSWQAFHQGRILSLIPLSSCVIDTALLFAMWEFIHGVRSRELVAKNALNVN